MDMTTAYAPQALQHQPTPAAAPVAYFAPTAPAPTSPDRVFDAKSIGLAIAAGSCIALSAIAALVIAAL